MPSTSFLHVIFVAFVSSRETFRHLMRHWSVSASSYHIHVPSLEVHCKHHA